jgi:hypothetical protein
MPQEEIKCRSCGAPFKIEETILNRVICHFCGSLYVLSPHVARVLVNNQPNVNQLIDRAWALHKDGKVDDAITLYREVIKFAPQNMNVRITLGSWLEEKKQHAEAIQR